MESPKTHYVDSCVLYDLLKLYLSTFENILMWTLCHLILAFLCHLILAFLYHLILAFSVEYSTNITISLRFLDYYKLYSQHFQRLEEQRISFFRESVWKCTNVDSKACVDHDEVSIVTPKVMCGSNRNYNVLGYFRNSNVGRRHQSHVKTLFFCCYLYTNIDMTSRHIFT